ncbi:anthranilate phosphoribosyltransferase [Helicovermis profundi]|uniref:Anthranilate phosphoribosyltransferase n=1 Tax=Helicovermis profundi TaxID=3065157 RepID=A0AAU9E2M6_9FIRM|nr:anthranilate phosphoribosyltransferase [Clostridia bacterium S502]
MRDNLNKLLKLEDLTMDQMYKSMNDILKKNISDIEISSFLTALEIKGVKKDELIGAVKCLKENAKKVEIKSDDVIIDTCGTGGDGKNTINISTGATIIAAGAGVKILKHGNRAVSSKSGSTDVLEELKIRIPTNKDDVKEEFIKHGVSFLYAPLYHKTLKNVANVRKKLGFNTIFNMLGPLVNPSNVKYQVVGVSNPSYTELYCEVLKYFGAKRALVVHGLDGIDEITITDKSKISELKDNKIKTYYIDPKDFGINKVESKEILGLSAKDNAMRIKKVFMGEEGAVKDILALNAGAYIYIYGSATSIKEGYNMALKSLENGDVFKKYVELTKFYSKY